MPQPPVFDGEALREEIRAAYGVDLLAEPIEVEPGLDPAEDLAARVRLAEHLADAIGPLDPTAPPSGPLGLPPGWAPLPGLDGAPPEPLAATARLLAWTREGGAEVDALDVRTTPAGYRTGHAGRPLIPGDRILFVPRRYMLLQSEVRGSALGAELVAAGIDPAGDHTLLAIALAVERRDPTSRWRPFLDALPTSFPTLPTFRDVGALAPLAGSPVIADLTRMRDAVVREHRALVERVPRLRDLALAELAWARAICSTRLFAVTVDGVEDRALIPVADLLDHGAGDITWGHDDGAGGLVIAAARELAAGDEIHLRYGLKSNARLLSHYGFCLSDNLDDVARVVVPRPPGDVLGDLIARLLWGRPLGAPAEVLVSKAFDDDTRRALSQARLAVATRREREQAIDDGRFDQGELRWLGERNEAAAWALLAQAARTRRDDLPSPPAGDGAWERAVGLLLRGEREVLDGLCGFVDEVAPLLATASRQGLRRLGNGAGVGLLGQYVRGVAGELP